MRYAENLIKWYDLTLETIASRLSEDKKRNVLVNEIAEVLRVKYNLTDNTQAHLMIYEKGMGIYDIVKEHIK